MSSIGLEHQRERLSDILRRFVSVDDAELSDLEMVRAVYKRFLRSREDYIIDPSE